MVDGGFACKLCYDKDPANAHTYKDRSGAQKCYYKISKHGDQAIKDGLNAAMKDEINKAMQFRAMGLYTPDVQLRQKIRYCKEATAAYLMDKPLPNAVI